MENIEKCSKCGKQISSTEFIENGGLCINCMNKKEAVETMEIKNSNVNKQSKNKVASIIKTLAIIVGILGSISGCFVEDLAIVFIIVSIISAIFIYAIGEGISLLQEIANNTNINYDKKRKYKK